MIWGLSPGGVAFFQALIDRDVMGEYTFTVLEVCVLSGTAPQAFMELVSEGILGPVGEGMWGFSGVVFILAGIPRVPVWKQEVRAQVFPDQAEQ